MPDHLDFLARLGLDTSTDERAVRRAYARLLKQIDQETEADRFQALREDYEHANAWLAWRAMHERQEQEQEQEGQQHSEEETGGHGEAAYGEQLPVLQASTESAAQNPSNASTTGHASAAQSAADVASAQSAPAPAAIARAEEVDPDALADWVFQQLLSELPRLQHGRMEFDESLWADLLRRYLADDRLFNIAASNRFELRIVYYLAGEHQRGHEALFNAAIAVFGWLTDRQRLSQFHHAGARINRAIDERDMLNAQPIAEQRVHKQVLSALRTRALPHPDQLRRLMPHLIVMSARFPVLMSVITDPAAVKHWDDVHSSLAPGAPDTTPEPSYSGDRSAIPAFVWFALIFIIGAIIRSVSAPSMAPRYDMPQQPVQAPAGLPYAFKPPTERDYAPLLDKLSRTPAPAFPAAPAASVPKGLPLSRAQLDDIRARIAYKVDKDAPPGLLAAEFEVYLAPGGKVDTVKFTRRSTDRRYDDAVEKAVKGSKPFPATTARAFSLRYWVRITRPQPPKDSAPEPVPRASATTPADGVPDASPRPREDTVRDEPAPAQ